MSAGSCIELSINPPGLSPAETRRLQALRDYAALDTPPDQALDDLAALAAQICGMPIALIALVDEQRVWFKAKVGWPADETPRAGSFFERVILEPDLLIVPDATKDARFAANPWVKGSPHVRFFVGMPLLTPAGEALGVLAVMDRLPGELTSAQQEALRRLSRQAIAQWELRRQSRFLAASESRLEIVTDNVGVGFVIVDQDRRYVYANKAYAEILDLPSSKIAGLRAADVLSGIYQEQVRSRLDRAFAGHCVTYELRRPTAKGDCYYTVRYEPKKSDGAVVSVAVVLTEITAYKKAEIASLRMTEIVESSLDAIIGKDLNGVITSWNKSAERLFGYTSDEIVGTSILRLIPADRQDEEGHILAKIRRGESVEHFETLRQTKDGRQIDISVSASPIMDAQGKITGVSKVARDITEQRQAEDAQRVSEALYRTLFEYAPDGILIANPQNVYIDVNASMCRMLGYSSEELIGLRARDILCGNDPACIEPAQEILNGHVDYRREWHFRRKDGWIFPAEVIATMMPDGNLLAMVRDITERKRLESRFRRLVDSNAQGVMFWSAKEGITGSNDAFLEILGYTREDLGAGLVNWLAIRPPECAETDRLALQEIAIKGITKPTEQEFVRKDGSRVTVLVGGARFEDDANEGVAFVLDLTERKKLERQFLRAQRMESIGTLAGGIAHDLNNVLSPILLSLEMLREYASDKRGRVLLDTLQSCALRGAAMVKQVLSFARGVDGERVVVSLVRLVQDLVKILRDTLPKSINLEFVPPGDLWTVTGDATQIHQVFMNLCINARDAMPNGGNLTITMENVELDETYAGMNMGCRAGAYVMVKVADTGTGMPSEIRDKIFEPFFTTKEVGKGTGLGLSTTLAIMKSHGGLINVYSELGKGTWFKVYLPADAAGAVVRSDPMDQAQLPRGRGELVLVVDDEEPIRRIVQGTLERFGYRTILACNGAEALAAYAQRQSEIAVVLTDMAMPVMDGPATIIALKAMNSSVKIIGTSGLPANDGVAKAIGAGVQHFVPKPYTAEAMLKTLRKILGDGVD